MELKDVLAKNLKMIAQAEGLSSRALASRCGMSQKTVWNMMEGEHSARLSNIESIAAGLGVSPVLLITEGLSAGALTSIKSPRMMADYLSLPSVQRARVDAMVKGFHKEPANELPIAPSAELQAVMGF